MSFVSSNLPLVIAVVALMTATLSSAAAGQEKVRTVPHQHAPIESLLLPDDRIVEMDYWADLFYANYGNETRDETILRMTRETDVIAIVRVTQVEPFFVEERSWFRTRVSGTADDVLKGPNKKKFEAQFDGGEITIKGVRVRGGGYPLLRQGSRYLIFVRIVDDVPWILHVFSLENQNAVARPPWARAKGFPDNPFVGRSMRNSA